MSYLSEVPAGTLDKILVIAEAYKKCTHPQKVNVCVGAYRNEEGKPHVLPSVKAAERRLLDDPKTNKEYPPVSGDAEFVRLALEFAYGSDQAAFLEEKVAGVQTLSGTGACRLAGEFYAKFLPPGTRIYVPSLTWAPHATIFRLAGLEVHTYRYFDEATCGLDWKGLVEDLQADDAPSGSVVLFHTCAHNPTGCDPTIEQWQELSRLCLEKSFHVLFDNAYQGFASGDVQADAASLRLFVKDGHHVIQCQSFAKNFGLYGERCGTLSVVCHNQAEKKAVTSQLGIMGRYSYGRPPIHGALIVRTILSDSDLRAQYETECRQMAERILTVRTLLVDQLTKVGSTHDWSHISRQIGMFAFTGLTKEMCHLLTNEHYIFLTPDGRISLSGINKSNIDHVVQSIHQVSDGKELTTSAK